MTKECRIHRPHIAWLINLENDLYDHVYHGVDIIIEDLLLKHKITYDDIDLIVSQEEISNYDVKLTFVKKEEYATFFLYNQIECMFGNIFTNYFNITENTKHLYFKVIPLEEL